MFHLLLVLILVAFGATSAAAADPGLAVPSPAAVVKVVPATLGFPETRAGRLASGWFPAFNEGEGAMRRFLEAHVSSEGLARRPIEDRLEVYREMHEAHGRLTPVEVRESRDDGLEVVAHAETGGRISISFLLEPGPAGALAGIRVMDIPDAADADDPGEPSDSGPTNAGPTPLPMTDDEVASALRTRLDSLATAGVFSGAVLLAHGDRVLLRQAYGFASRRDRVPNRADTRFNLGSINKIFTRIAIEQLAAAGKLHLTDTIDRYLPDYPEDKGRRITIAQLVEHRAGTGDIFNSRFAAMDVSRLRTTGDWMDLMRDQPLEFDPGTRQEYSNAGYVLLGAIIEKVSGRSYYDYVRERVFGPAGMKATGSYPRDEAAPNRATGYSRRSGARADSGWRENTEGLPGRGSSAGGGYSTVDDLRRFADAMRAGRLGLPPEAGGLGIAGGSPGVNAALESVGDYTVVVLANLDPPAAERVASSIRGWLRRAAAGRGPERKVIGAGGGGPGPRMIGAGGGGRRILQAGPGDPGHKPRHTDLPPGGVDVPMLRRGHLPAVEVMINGRGPFRFGIDTGGAGSARMDSALAARLGLEIGEVMAGDPSGRNARAMPLVALDSIAIGGARFAGLTASVRNYNQVGRGEPVDGILGFGLFADCLFTLDYPANRVRIAHGELPPADGAEVLDYRDEHGIPEITLRVAGREVAADVDAGSMGGFSLPEAFASQLPLASEPRIVGRGRTVSNTFEIKAADLKGEIAFGRYRFSNPTIEFQPIFPVANVGARVLRDFRITFDQKNQRMRLEKTEAGAGR